VPAACETAVISTGEVRLCLETIGPLALDKVRSALEYSFAHGRDHRTVTDPWEYAFGDPRRIETDAMFSFERDRVIQVVLSEVSGSWDADLLYYPPRICSARYHWSSSEGTLHPVRSIPE
jgi:hypothetical protein